MQQCACSCAKQLVNTHDAQVARKMLHDTFLDVGHATLLAVIFACHAEND